MKKQLKAIGKRVQYWRKYYHGTLPNAAKFADIPNLFGGKLNRESRISPTPPSTK